VELNRPQLRWALVRVRARWYERNTAGVAGSDPPTAVIESTCYSISFSRPTPVCGDGSGPAFAPDGRRRLPSCRAHLQRVRPVLANSAGRRGHQSLMVDEKSPRFGHET